MIPNIKPGLRKYARRFNELRAQKVNESETVARLREFFSDVLGYKDMEVSSETEMKGKYVDLCLKIDNNIEMVVEAKAAAVQLRARQVEQAKHYASENGFQWALLTNGVDWNLYHVTFDETDGIEYTPAFIISLAEGSDLDAAAENLALLHRRSIAKGELERFWERKSALCAGSIGKAIFHESVLSVLRREIRRSCDVLIDPEDLAVAVHDLFTQEAREEMGPLRIRKRRKKAKSQPVTKLTPVPRSAPVFG